MQLSFEEHFQSWWKRQTVQLYFSEILQQEDISRTFDLKIEMTFN